MSNRKQAQSKRGQTKTTQIVDETSAVVEPTSEVTEIPKEAPVTPVQEVVKAKEPETYSVEHIAGLMGGAKTEKEKIIAERLTLFTKTLHTSKLTEEKRGLSRHIEVITNYLNAATVPEFILMAKGLIRFVEADCKAEGIWSTYRIFDAFADSGSLMCRFTNTLVIMADRHTRLRNLDMYDHQRLTEVFHEDRKNIFIQILKES